VARSLRGLLSRGPAQPAVVAGGCDDLRDAPRDAEPRTPDGCQECLDQGTSWVHLRLCLACGHVGCCDSSPWKHADGHAREDGHAVVRSFEAGESWRWCYVHELLG